MTPRPLRRILALLVAAAVTLAGPIPAYALRAGLEGATEAQLLQELSAPTVHQSAGGLEEPVRLLEHNVRLGRYLVSLTTRRSTATTVEQIPMTLLSDDQQYFGRVITTVTSDLDKYRVKLQRLGLQGKRLAEELLFLAFRGRIADRESLRSMLRQESSQYDIDLSPLTGIAQIWLSRHLFRYFSDVVKKEFTPQAIAVKVSAEAEGVSFIMLDAERRQDRDYLNENIPHETAHIFFKFLKDHGVLPQSDAYPDGSDDMKGFQAYREELVCRMFGGAQRPFPAETSPHAARVNTTIRSIADLSPPEDVWLYGMIWPALKAADYRELESFLAAVQNGLEVRRTRNPVIIGGSASPPPTQTQRTLPGWDVIEAAGAEEFFGDIQVQFYRAFGRLAAPDGAESVDTASLELIRAGAVESDPAVRRAVIENAAAVPQVARIFHHPAVVLPTMAGVTAVPLRAEPAAAQAHLAASELTPRDVILLPDTVEVGREHDWRPAAGARTPILVVPMATALAAHDLNPLAAIASALAGRLLRVRPETILRAGLEGRDVFSVQY